GRFDSALRTAEQTQLALLWQAAGLVDENRIARSAVPSANSLVDNARLFALLNIAACDALIAGFDSKFAYNLWRPYHAIRLADTDGNADTAADPAWNSLFLAPRLQEYISNHASLTGSVMHVLAREPGRGSAAGGSRGGRGGWTRGRWGGSRRGGGRRRARLGTRDRPPGALCGHDERR